MIALGCGGGDSEAQRVVLPEPRATPWVARGASSCGLKGRARGRRDTAPLSLPVGAHGEEGWTLDPARWAGLREPWPSAGKRGVHFIRHRIYGGEYLG